MELILIRHTKVDVDSGICYGFSDVGLADTFLQEAEEIKTSLGKQVFDEVWASPLTRCTKLTEELFPNVEYKTDSRLKELNFGRWEGLSWEDIYEQPYGKQWMDDYVQCTCPNGESFVDLYKRAADFYDEKKHSFNNKKVAIVSHSGIIRSYRCLFQGIELKNAFNLKLNYGETLKFTL